MELADPGFQIQGIPENLVIVYDSGHTHAMYGRTRYVVTADGKGKKYEIRGVMSSDTEPTSTFSISPEGLKRIVDTINRTRFFKVAPNHENPNISGGSSHYISVQAGSVSHMVVARMTSVPAIDEISKAIFAEMR
ncbi:MAG TPA: hypothetical protein PKO06_21510 [Candidatus Ozemobacteraceae bacterium]|nr:hypothetical protein [Candidatus Ozemobacteraceae bacterium]